MYEQSHASVLAEALGTHGSPSCKDPGKVPPRAQYPQRLYLSESLVVYLLNTTKLMPALFPSLLPRQPRTKVFAYLVAIIQLSAVTLWHVILFPLKFPNFLFL